MTETFNGNACSVIMKSTSAIVGCESDNYGAAFVYKFKDTEPTFEMHDEAKILNCKALNGFGGALGVQNGKAVIDGSCLISGNSATAGASAIRLEGDTTLTMSDKAKITNNVDASAATSEHHGAVGGSSTAGTVFTGKVTLSGSPYIYDNTGSNDSDNQCNLIDSTAKNDGKQIYVDEAGLTKEAKIGVYSANNSSASLVFARTVASKSGNTTNSINFQNFKNDKNDTLTGAAGDENQIVWSKYIPVNIVINQEKYLTDHWYTLQLQNSTTGARTRFHVKVAAGTTSGNVICMVQAGLKNFISCVEDGSAYAYTLSNPVYVNTPDTSSTGKGEALGTDTDEKADSASFLCGLTVNSTNANKGNISTTSGLRELTFTSAWTTISNEATKITAQSGVTNTFNQEPTVGLFAAVRSFFSSFR